MRRLLLLLVLAISTASALAEELRVPLLGRGELVLVVPDGWSAQVRAPRPDLPPTIAITSQSKRDLTVLVTPMWPPNSSITSTSREELRDIVTSASSRVRSKAIEKEFPLVEFSSGPIVGYHFSATDREPESDGFKFLTQGAASLDELRITFTILMNGDPSNLREKALDVIREMRRQGKRGAT
jgi:hypothetical protein